MLPRRILADLDNDRLWIQPIADEADARAFGEGRHQSLVEPTQHLLPRCWRADGLLVLEIVDQNIVGPRVVMLDAAERLSRALSLEDDAARQNDFRFRPRRIAAQSSEDRFDILVRLVLMFDRFEALTGAFVAGAD